MQKIYKHLRQERVTDEISRLEEHTNWLPIFSCTYWVLVVFDMCAYMRTKTLVRLKAYAECHALFNRCCITATVWNYDKATGVKWELPSSEYIENKTEKGEKSWNSEMTDNESHAIKNHICSQNSKSEKKKL